MRAGRSSIIRSAFAAGTGKIVWEIASRSLSFAMTVLVARKLGAAGYGTFAVYWYAAWMLSQTTDLGLHLASMRSLASRQASPVFWSAVVAKTALTLAVGFAVVASLFTGLVRSEPWLVLALLAAHLIGSWTEFLGVILRSHGFIAREGVVLTTLRFGWLAGAFFALSQSPDLTLVAVSLALAGIPGLVAGVEGVRRSVQPRGGKATREELRRLVREALPLALAAVITLLYLRADLLILAAVRGAGEAGLFQSAFRVFEASFVISGGIAAGTFPILVSRLGGPRFEALSRSIWMLLLCAGGMIAMTFVLAGESVITILFGEDFLPAAIPLAILGLGIVPVFSNALTTHLLVATGRGRMLVIALLARLTVGVTLDVALAPAFGARGAAASVAVAEWCLLVISLASVRDLLGFSHVAATLSPERASSC